MARRARAVCRQMTWLALIGVSGACIGAPPPSVEPVYFQVDVDELEQVEYRRRAAEAARVLTADPDLHVLIVGHADEDNSDAYNHDLSVRRGDHVRDLMLAADAGLAGRIEVQARGEWDPDDPGLTETAKSLNRRVDFVFYYPRQCDPRPNLDFVRCELSRFELPEPEPEPEPPPEPEPEPEPEIEPLPDEPPQFIGPYVFGSAGYAVGSAELLRQYATWGVGAGRIWAPTPVFRISAGASFDHLIDRGWVFDESSRCRGYCDEIKRPYARLLPETRVGATRGRVFAYARVTTGILVQREEGERTVTGSQNGEPTVERGPRRWRFGGNVGIGPGVAILLARRLYMGLDTQLAITTQMGAGDAGNWIFDAKGSLGWQF